MAAPRPNLYRRLTSSVPILVTVIVHVIVIAVAIVIVSTTIIGKKKAFDAAPPPDASFQKQVEHRIQVARRGGGSAPSPVSAQRIVSTASDALQLPDMPELPQVGASSLSGMGFGAGMGAPGGGTGFGTGIGGVGGIGSGFMTLNFLGMTSQRASKVVFIVDISLDVMDVRKGGFEAFTIIRDQIMRLVAGMSPATQFDVVIFERGNVRLFADSLLPSTVENKNRFFEWMKHVNSSASALGVRSALGSVPWQRVVPPTANLDPHYAPGWWITPIHAALQLKPDTLFLITGSAGNGWIELSPEVIAQRKQAQAQADANALAQIKGKGIEPDKLIAARNAAFAQARADIDEINRQQEAKHKPPFVVADRRRFLDKDFQNAVHQAGYPKFSVDLSGWSINGQPNWFRYENPAWGIEHTGAKIEDAQKYISQLQNAFLPQRAALNIFYFVGPDYKPGQDSKNLSATAGRYGGTFSVLTTQRLKEIQQQQDQAKK